MDCKFEKGDTENLHHGSNQIVVLHLEICTENIETTESELKSEVNVFIYCEILQFLERICNSILIYSFVITREDPNIFVDNVEWISHTRSSIISPLPMFRQGSEFRNG